MARPAARLERWRSVVEEYESGKTLAEVGAMFGLSHEGVRQILIKMGNGTRGKRGAAKFRFAPFYEQLTARNHEIIERYKTGRMSAAHLAQQMGLRVPYVCRVLRDAGVFERRNVRSKPGRNAEMIRLFRDTDLPIARIAELCGLKNEAYCRVALHRLGWTMRRRKMARKKAA